MAMMPEHFLRQVQQATDIVDLIGRYVTIRKRGKDFVGLCPFHDEKTPSFSVSPTRQIFKCFGCGAGGGAFQFVMRHQGLNFPEAVKFLAEQAGIPVPRDEHRPAEPPGMDRASLLKLTAFAADFFRKRLYAPEGAEALDYARRRGLKEPAMERFALGYAPQGWDKLRGAALAAGYAEGQLLAAGLAANRETGGSYDRFRNRLIFPISDQSGRVIAFGGRALAADEQAKYLNSPETPLFDKSANLYGLDAARRAIAAANAVIVVEGYFDVVIPSQAGVENIVATLGTALTERHVRTLSRMAADVVLLFDSDAAGQAAAQRALELFIAQRMNVRVAAVPDGKDPCDFVMAHGGEALRQLVAEAPDALEFAWRGRLAALASDSLVERNRAGDEFLALLAGSTAYGAIDPMRQGMLVNRLSHMLRVPAESVAQRLRGHIRQVPPATPAPAAAAPPGRGAAAVLGLAGCCRRILEILICEPEHFEMVARELGPEDFEKADPLLGAVARRVWQLAEQDELSLDALLATEAGETAGGGGDWGSLVTDLAESGRRRGNYLDGLAAELQYIEHRRHRREVDQLKRRSDDEALRALADHNRRPDPRRRPF